MNEYLSVPFDWLSKLAKLSLRNLSVQIESEFGAMIFKLGGEFVPCLSD